MEYDTVTKRILSEKEHQQRIDAARKPRSAQVREAASARLKAVHATAQLRSHWTPEGDVIHYIVKDE
jgi:hypothetical protein